MEEMDKRIAAKLASKVKAGDITIDEVPEMYKEEVKKIIAE